VASETMRMGGALESSRHLKILEKSSLESPALFGGELRPFHKPVGRRRLGLNKRRSQMFGKGGGGDICPIVGVFLLRTLPSRVTGNFPGRGAKT